MFKKERDGYDRFTERARKVLALAQEEAQRMQHNYIGSEHILLGLVRESESVAGRVLQTMGVNLDKMRETVSEVIGKGSLHHPSELGLTIEAKQVIQAAIREAQQLLHRFIGTEHLLLGLISFLESVAVQVLRAMGIEEQSIRTQTMQTLSSHTSVSGETEERHSVREMRNTQQDKDRFDKFDSDAKKVLQRALEEAQRFQHNYIGTEHLLLGLVGLEESVAGQVLRRLGVELYKVRNAVEFIIGRGDRIVLGEVGLTPRAKKVVELAVDEAQRMNHAFIGTEHLLLGLVREGEGIAAGVLESLGVKLERVRGAVLEIMGQGEDLLKVASAYVRGEKPLGSLVSGVQDADDLVPEPADGEERGNFFTIRARRVLVQAREEAQRYQQECIGTEHLLLSLVRESNGLAYHVLRRQGIEIERILTATQFLIVEEKLSEPGEADGFTTDGKKALALAIDEAREISQTAIGTEHLLLGLLRCEGIASGILITRGLTLHKARAEVRRLMGLS